MPSRDWWGRTVEGVLNGYWSRVLYALAHLPRITFTCTVFYILLDVRLTKGGLRGSIGELVEGVDVWLKSSDSTTTPDTSLILSNSFISDDQHMHVYPVTYVVRVASVQCISTDIVGDQWIIRKRVINSTVPIFDAVFFNGLLTTTQSSRSSESLISQLDNPYTL